MLAVAFLAAGTARAGPLSPGAAASLQRRAHAKMKQLEFEAAIPLLERVLQSSALSPAGLAKVNVDLGVSLANLGRDDDARRAFEQAVKRDAKVELAGDVSPKIRALFDDAKQAAQPPPAPPPEPALVIQAPPRPTPPPAPVAAVEAPRPSPSRGLVVPIALEAVAAAALGVGIGTGVASAGAAHSLQASLNPRSTVDGLVAQQGTLAAVSITSYVVAGVAAIAGVAVYLLEGRPADKEAAAGSGAALPLAVSF